MLPAGQLPRDLRVKTDVNYEMLTKALEALSNPVRLKLLAFLIQPHYLEEIASDLKMTRQAARKHLDKLVGVGVLERRSGVRDSGPVTEYLISPQALFLIHDEFAKLGSLRPLETSDLMVRTRIGAPGGSARAQATGPVFYTVRGLHPGHLHQLRHTGDDAWLIGRDPRCAVPLAHDPYVSNRHAEVRWEKGRFALSDLSSTNGTEHNWERLPAGASAALEHGDVVGVGKSLLLFWDSARKR